MASNRHQRGRPPHADILTPGEWRVVHAVQHGMTNAEIAARRGISQDAVKFHITNAMAKLDVPNRKALRRWFRAPKTSALSALEGGKRMPLRLGSIGQISRTVKDIKHAEAWYGSVLGLPHLYSFGTMAFFDCGGIRLYLTQCEDELPSESIIYLKVENIEAAYEELQAKGVEFVNAPHMIHRHADGTEEWLAVFQDPEGRPLAVLSQAKP
jgi:DNA-binding CsgD family transcriptional regulator/predicted enzyme related to lactoylglutathione lyase